MNTQSLLIKSRNYYALEMEAQPSHMTFRLHHLDFSENCDTMPYANFIYVMYVYHNI